MIYTEVGVLGFFCIELHSSDVTVRGVDLGKQAKYIVMDELSGDLLEYCYLVGVVGRRYRIPALLDLKERGL